MRDWPPNPVIRYQRAIFLDRDGTINVDTHYPCRVDELSFLPGAMEGLTGLSALPLHIIVVSNQAGIALRRFTREEMSRFNAELRSRVERASGRIDAFYFCEHLELKDLSSGEQPCACSKPSPGMLLEAAGDFRLDLAESFVIGDKTSDIAAGEAVGCTTILVNTGKAGNEENALPVAPTYSTENLLEAAVIIESHLVHAEQAFR